MSEAICGYACYADGAGSMPYVLCRMVLAEAPTVEITKAEYERVKPARAAINELIAVEENYDAVMENYVELEETIHNLAIRNLAFIDYHYEELAAPLNQISRRVSNLLSSTRLYRRPTATRVPASRKETSGN